MKARWFWFWISLAYLLRLRGPVNSLQRWLKNEHKAIRRPLPKFDTPKQLEAYLRANFEYRKDETRVGGKLWPLDWVTEPEVFQGRLGTADSRDGDCDDYHHYAGTQLLRMEDVAKVLMLSVGYPSGGHTCCVFQETSGKWFLLNYRISPISDPNKAPKAIAEWGRKGPTDTAEVKWYVFESLVPQWRAVAIGPTGKVAG